jgi:hypothetical protein
VIDLFRSTFSILECDPKGSVAGSDVALSCHFEADFTTNGGASALMFGQAGRNLVAAPWLRAREQAAMAS